MKKVILSLVMVSLFFACSKDEDVLESPVAQEAETPLVADFKFESDSVNENQSLVIENLSSGALEYTWDFGNGETLTGENPDFKFLSHGIYNVTLTVTNSNGKTATAENTINVLCLFGGGVHTTEESES